jgi:hypothetical protein
MNAIAEMFAIFATRIAKRSVLLGKEALNL